MNHIEQPHSAPGFVCLKVSNQVPSRRLATKFENLSFCFLNSILS
jgi:hypothetical protein